MARKLKDWRLLSSFMIVLLGALVTPLDVCTGGVYSVECMEKTALEIILKEFTQGAIVCDPAIDVSA